MADARIWTDVVTRAIIALNGMTPRECFARYGLHVRGRTLYSHATAVPTVDRALPDVSTKASSAGNGLPDGAIAVFARHMLTPSVRLAGIREAAPAIVIDGHLPETIKATIGDGALVGDLTDFSSNPALAELSGAVVTEVAEGERHMPDGTRVETTLLRIDPIWQIVEVEGRRPAHSAE